MTRATPLALALLLAAAPAAAAPQAGDGAYRGTVDCSAIGASPAFRQTLAVIVREGRFALQRGTPGEDGSETLEGLVDLDGGVVVSGSYRAETEKTIRYEGRVEENRILAGGRRGPRECKMVLEGPPSAGVEPPFKPAPVAAERREIVGARIAGNFACAEPPAPPRDLLVESFYKRDDPSFSIVDPEAYATRNRQTAPLAAFAAGLARMGDRYVAASPRDAGPARCIAHWLSNWAAEGAMLGRVNQQGAYERKWTLATAAINFALIADAEEIDAELRARITGWLDDLAWATVAEYARKPFAEQNNHLNWAALASLAAGVATGDKALFDWGIAAARGALGSVAADGSLPRELARRQRALHYHRFALEPLALADALAAANGIDLSTENGGALARLAAYVRTGYDNPEGVARVAGVAQEGMAEGNVAPGNYAWAEIYVSLHEDEALAAILERVRGKGLSSTWLGGNLTLRFGPAKR